LNEAGEIVNSLWEELPVRYHSIGIDYYVIMPNHFHGIIVIQNVGAQLAAPVGGASPAPTLGDIIRTFKSISTLHINRQCHRSGALWQRNYYEHIIRHEQSLCKIREYIRNNPLQWSLDRENPDNMYS